MYPHVKTTLHTSNSVEFYLLISSFCMHDAVVILHSVLFGKQGKSLLTLFSAITATNGAKRTLSGWFTHTSH